MANETTLGPGNGVSLVFGSTNPAWLADGRVRSVSWSGMSRSTIDTTTSASDSATQSTTDGAVNAAGETQFYTESKPGTCTLGQLNVECLRSPDDFVAGTPKSDPMLTPVDTLTVSFRKGDASSATKSSFACDAWVSNVAPTEPNGTERINSVTFELSGKPTYVAEAAS